MTGPRKIYVDFSVRDPEGRLYVARLGDFDETPALGSLFRGTDYDEFDVECRVLAVDRVRGVVYHRPVDPSSVPGTALDVDPAEASEESTLDTSAISEPELMRS